MSRWHHSRHPLLWHWLLIALTRPAIAIPCPQQIQLIAWHIHLDEIQITCSAVFSSMKDAFAQMKTRQGTHLLPVPQQMNRGLATQADQSRHLSGMAMQRSYLSRAQTQMP